MEEIKKKETGYTRLLRDDWVAGVFNCLHMMREGESLSPHSAFVGAQPSISPTFFNLPPMHLTSKSSSKVVSKDCL